MKKSNEKEGLPKVDYSKVPKEIEEIVNRQPYVIEEKAKLTWDGRQFIVRIPSEITKEMNITKENQMRFRLTKPLPDSSEKPELKIELI